MGIPAYSLDEVDSRIEPDGTRCYITLKSKETDDRGFRADLECLSAHVILLQQVCAEMARRLSTSGKSAAIQNQVGTDPMRALSFQLAPFADGRGASLRVQTESGPLVSLELPADILHLLRQRIDEAIPLLEQSHATKKH